MSKYNMHPLYFKDQSGGLQQQAEKKIFLSYGHEENVDRFVDKLQKDLEAHGFGVWRDERDISAGSLWLEDIGGYHVSLRNHRGL